MKIIVAINDFTDHVALKRGSAKLLIPYIADDFTEPIAEFNDYM